MGIRQQKRYGSWADDEDIEEETEEVEDREEESAEKDPRALKPRTRPSRGRSTFDVFLLFFGKFFLLVIVFIPRAILRFVFRSFAAIFGFHRGKREKNSVSRLALRRFFKFCLKIGAVAFVFLLGYTFFVSRDLLLLDPNRLRERNVHQSTKIYDRTGEHLLYEIFTDQKRTLTTLDKIPSNLKNGVIATEDKSFYSHFGVRPLSIARAVVYGVFTDRPIGGTSTLTQQLVKNAILTNERSLNRKLKEIILSLRLEQKYSKDEILQIYFNEIPYGSVNYGVEAAALSYFGKSVSELNLEQSATLAGFPKAPSKYLTNPEALKERRNFVLRRMKEEGYLTEDTMKQTQTLPLSLSRKVENIKAPHFVFLIQKQLSEQYGEAMIDTGGLTVITSLDPKAQEAAEKAIADKEKLLTEAGANNAALVALDPKNGQILAYVGSRDFQNKEIDGWFDVVSDSRRQPGSSIKPIIYAAAFEKGYTPETILFDTVTNFAVSGKPYTPKNYNLKEHGPVTMRQALQGSLNIPAVKTFYLVGEKKGVEFASRLGYTTFNSGNFGLSLVLGGGEVKMLEHVNAYGVFADNGVYHAPVSILKVQAPDGEILQEWKEDKGKQVIEPKVAATITNVLNDDTARAYVFGARGPLTLSDRPVAAKTGTTDRYRDAWTVGYTPNLVAGIWTGNSDNTEMKQGFGGSRVSGQIWNAFMKEALKEKPIENFPAPPPNDAQKPVLRGATGGGVTLDINKVTGKRSSTSTPAHLVVQRTFVQPHDILHYVNKDNPRGPYPSSPADDPQYLIWERSVQDWITRKKASEPNWSVSFEEPPTEFDDAYSLELIPKLTIYSPIPGSVFRTRHLTANIDVQAPRGVKKVTYLVDKRPIATLESWPFSLDVYVRELENGPHELALYVEDDIGNRLEEIIPFSLEATDEAPYVTWVKGVGTFSQTDFPATFFLNSFKLNKMRELRVYAQKDSNRTLLTSINNFTNLVNDQIPISWSAPPEPGKWSLTTEITDTSGVVTTGDTFDITIN